MGGTVQPASLTDAFRSTRDSVDYGWSKQQYAWKRMEKTGHLMTSFAEELKNDNPQRT